jgi:lipoyl(octanoyl) transferase
MPPPEIVELGRRDYQETLRLQRDLVAQRASDAVPDRILLVEHPAVYTAGRSRHPEDLLDPTVVPVVVERGGRITFHGPGQLVIYPFLKLEGPLRDARGFLRRLESAGKALLRAFDITGERSPDGTGLFVGDRKIASIGIAIRHWVTFHGMALNVDLDLQPFHAIRPCGFAASRMTTMRREAPRGPAVTLERVWQHTASELPRLLAAAAGG